MAVSPCSSIVDEKGRELVVHGTVPFPIAWYDDDLLNNPVPWHWHEELEAGYITEGSIEVAIGAEKRVLQPGDGFFVNAEVLHGAWGACSSSCKLNSFVFHPRLVGGSLDSVYWQKYVAPLISDRGFDGGFFVSEAVGSLPATDAVDSRPASETRKMNMDILSCIKSTWELCENCQPGYEFEVRSLLSHLILLLVQRGSESPSVLSDKALRDSARIKTMLQFVHEHYSEELTIEQIAANASISTSEALRCFKSSIGTTPIQYVKQYRIQKAAELLTSTNLKIAEIGALCGFQEMSYFAKSFRELKGVTPSAFREKT